MRILHVDTGAEMRGGQRQALLLMQALRSAGHECILLARKGSPLWEAAAGDFETHSAGLQSVWRWSTFSDVVHAHDARSHTLAAVASRRPFVVSRRVAFPVGDSALSQWKYGRAQRYLAVSRFAAGELVRAGVPESWIDVVYDAVPSCEASGEWKRQAPAIGLASADPEKGRDLLESAAERAGIELRLSGALEQDLKNASMFVYITRSEGLGSAALLAMSMGVPVIASNVGGLPEIVENGVSGLLVQNDIENIAAAILRLLGEEGLAEALRQNAKREVDARFTPQRLLDATLHSYRRALAR